MNLLRSVFYPGLPLAVFLVVAMVAAPAGADDIGVRVGAGTGGASGYNFQEAYWRPSALAPRLGDPAGWHVAAYTEFNAGRVSRSGESMYTGGTVLGGWLTHPQSPLSIGIGTGPTYISERTLGGRDFGGHWQFTSHAAARLRVADQLSIGYRIQHTSNAGLYSANDGYNIQALEVRLSF